MPVQTLFEGVVRTVHALAYAWATDGTLLFALDSRDSGSPPLTYGTLLRELQSLCQFQLRGNVVVGLAAELVEVLTLYHDFDRPAHAGNTLLLVSTPPDEYFEAA